MIDPLGGSYFVETLTNEFEAKMLEYMERVEELGGTLRAIELNYFQREIADFAYDYAQRKASGDRAVVGVNKFVDETEDHKVEVHAADPHHRGAQDRPAHGDQAGARQRARGGRRSRALVEVAKDPDANLMPATIDAVRAQASMGEIVYRLEELFGRYSETPVF